MEESYQRHRPLLPVREERPCSRRATEERNELAAPHSITSSACGSMLSTLIARVPLSSEILNLGLAMGLEDVDRRRLDALAFDPARVALRGGCGLGRADEDERDTDGKHASEHWGTPLAHFLHCPRFD
jgi:hypothetical protein